MGPCCSFYLGFCVVLLCFFTFWGLCCDVCYCIKTMFGSSLPPVVCRRAHVLFTLYVFACAQWCPTHIVLCFCFVFPRHVYHMLPVSLDCPFLIGPSVFSNVYILHCDKTWNQLEIPPATSYVTYVLDLSDFIESKIQHHSYILKKSVKIPKA